MFESKSSCMLNPTNRMKPLLFIILIMTVCLTSKGQTCDEIMEWVKSESYGTTYTSYNSDAISKATFYDVTVDYQTHYFAIVCFKKGSYGCNEYIYQVSSSTKMYYSMNYVSSAGKAFWEYIEPYSDNLGCAPDFD
jgi:hypothetical protein